MKKHLNDSHWRHKILPAALKILYRPWLISLGLHGLLLMVALPDHPLNESPKPLKEVKITDLPASTKESTSKSSPRSSTPKPTRNASTPRQDIDAPPQLPKPTPSVTPTPKPIPSATPTPEPTTPTSTPGVKIEGGELEEFLGELTPNSETAGDKASKPSPDLFNQPGLFFDQLGSEPKPKSSILTMKLINGMSPDQVQIKVLSSQKSSGKDFTITPLENFGGGTVWEVKQESKVWYLNLVPTTGSTKGTVVVEWKRDPTSSSKN